MQYVWGESVLVRKLTAEMEIGTRPLAHGELKMVWAS